MSDNRVQPDAYRVALDVYEGPLDLLLRLIERQELDITRVSLALVTDQYLEYIARLVEVKSDDLADFLVVAAKLLVIKSKSLLPPPAVVEPEAEEDIGEQLARQLAEYRRFKQAAGNLRLLEQRGWRTYVRLAATPKLQPQITPGSLAPAQLVSALMQALAEQPMLESVDTVVQPVHVHITDCIRTIRELLAQHDRLAFSQALTCAHSRLEVIVLFLAVLELVKQQHILVEQDELYGEIYLNAHDNHSQLALQADDIEDYGELDLE